MKIVIALGANLGDPETTFDAAERALEDRIGPILRRSRRQWTKPLLDPANPLPDQPRYLNSAVMIETGVAPLLVLSTLLQIEHELGRTRTVKWGPRTLDLDLIAADDAVITEPQLVVPHPEMHKRRFVLEPLVEIWPEWRHPLLNKTAVELLAQVAELPAG